MAAYLLCLQAGTGVPLFTRIKGDIKPLPFPVIGSLNGVHMYGTNNGVDLLTTNSPDAKVIWKVFHNSITLIYATKDDNASDYHGRQLLDLIFQSMVLLYGLDDLTHIKNVERFKKDIKVCFRLIDSLLEQADLTTFSDLTCAVDVITGQDNAILQSYLDAFVDCADSPYGCLQVHGKVAVATPKWWDLTSTELILLAVLVMSLPRCSSRDVPIFLPHASPKVPHRLLTFQLIHGSEVCVLCGPTPSLSELEREVGRFWRTAYEILKSTVRLHPRNIPSSISIDQNVLGFILINRETKRCLCSVQPQTDEGRRQGRSMSASKRREILRAFYKSVIGSQFPTPSSVEADVDSQEVAVNEFHTSLPHESLDTYINTETHKCYAMRHIHFQMFALFTPSIPTYAMRSVVSKLLNSLLKEKTVQV